MISSGTRGRRPVQECGRTAAHFASALALLHAGGAAGQVVERNLPPEPAPSSAAPAIPVAPPAERDDRPIGPALTSIVLLGAREPVRSKVSPGLVLDGDPRATGARDRREVARFLGRPISRKLIAEVQAAVVRIHRRAGFPFVDVSTPEQEITSGVLELRVVEFRAGRIHATGLGRTPPGYVESRLRAKTGGPIDAGDLAEDVDALNRNPFRQVQAVFAPGAGLGVSDLELAVSQTKPWRVYGGYAQSGSAATGRDRYDLGGQFAGLPGLPDALASYQFTASDDGFANLHPKYVSHAVRLTLPTAPRQAVEFTFDRVESNTPAQDFVSRALTDELSLGYRFAPSDLTPAGWPRLRGDVSFGLEARQADRLVLFGPAAVAHTIADVVQVYVGWATTFADRLGATEVNATLHVSPGGIDPRDTDAAYRAFSQGRTNSAEYAYVNVQASRTTVLPHGLSLATAVIAQYAGAALPDTEQAAIGAPSLVRGYSLDDGAFDSAVVLRDELRAPAVRLLPPSLGAADAFQPRVFVDAGWAHERELRRDLSVVSAGAGADWRLGAALQLGGDVECPLEPGTYTRTGACRFEGRLTASY